MIEVTLVLAVIVGVYLFLAASFGAASQPVNKQYPANAEWSDRLWTLLIILCFPLILLAMCFDWLTRDDGW